MTAECQKSQTFYVIHLVHKQFNHFIENVLITNGSICTHPQFNVHSGGLVECLDEPWHVGVYAAGSLTTTLLSIPQWVISVESVIRKRQLNVITSLTIVVITNERRNLGINITIAGTNTCRKTQFHWHMTIYVFVKNSHT